MYLDMFVKIKNSIVFRIGAMLTAMTALAILTMFSSFIISEMADNDAAAINLSGSMRQHSFMMLSSALVKDDDNQIHRIEEERFKAFEEILKNPVLTNQVGNNADNHLTDLYRQVEDDWFLHVRPMFESFLINAQAKAILVEKVEAFVTKIDALVFEYQQEAESKIEWLRIIQVLALFITLILFYVAMTNVYVNIDQPLALLTELAIKIKNGNLGEKIELNTKDELGVLASAFNAMSETLSKMYDDLELTVEDKTKELKRSNDSLIFLFKTARNINESNFDYDFQPILDEVAFLTGLKDMDLCLSTPESSVPYIHMLSLDDAPNRENCDGAHCESCKGDSCFVTTDTAGYEMKFPLVQDDQNFGVMVVRVPFNQALDAWQHQLLQSVADQISVALSLRNQENQERRVSLLNERTIIARELHDSLAQSLSYLKIQVTRLQKAYDKGAQAEMFQELMDEIREGLSSAYRQLRELLSTFRLQIDGSGLKGALLDTVERMQSRSDMNIQLNFDIDAIPLLPNEEIHLLQLAKESLQNAVHHSKGKSVTLNLFCQNNHITLKVCDDGIGIPDDPEKMNHYGLAIMKERSKHLNGALKLYRQPKGGTGVEMQFTPNELAP
jgi:two-component system nitrate/nitrite sensor histidine kinase NarX